MRVFIEEQLGIILRTRRGACRAGESVFRNASRRQGLPRGGGGRGNDIRPGCGRRRAIRRRWLRQPHLAGRERPSGGGGGARAQVSMPRGADEMLRRSPRATTAIHRATRCSPATTRCHRPTTLCGRNATRCGRNATPCGRAATRCRRGAPTCRRTAPTCGRATTRCSGGANSGGPRSRASTPKDRGAVTSDRAGVLHPFSAAQSRFSRTDSKRLFSRLSPPEIDGRAEDTHSSIRLRAAATAVSCSSSVPACLTRTNPPQLVVARRGRERLAARRHPHHSAASSRGLRMQKSPPTGGSKGSSRGDRI